MALKGKSPSVIVVAIALGFSLILPTAVSRADELGPTEAPQIAIADPQLRSCISKATGDDLSAEALAGVKELTCAYVDPTDAEREKSGQPLFVYPVTDVTGLEALAGLKKLSLSRFTFPVIDDKDDKTVDTAVAFPEFKELTELKIGFADSLPNAWNTPKLEQLSLTDGTFATVPALSSLEKLTHLDLAGSSAQPGQLGEIASSVKVTPSPAKQSENVEPAAPSESATPATNDTASSGEPAEVPTPASQAPQARGTRGSTPVVKALAANSAMPAGALRQCAFPGVADGDPALLLQNTSTLPSLTVNAGCAGSAGLTDWTGAEFLSGVKSVTVQGTSTSNRLPFALPTTSLRTVFPALENLLVKYTTLTDVTLLSPKADPLPNLVKIDMQYNQINKVDDLYLPGKVSASANFAYNKIASVTNVEVHGNGGMTYAYNSGLTRVDNVSMPDLTSGNFNFHGNEITSLSNISAPKLSTGKFQIQSNKLTSVRNVSFPSLTSGQINFSSNELSKFADVDVSVSPSSTGRVDLSYNKLSDVAGLDSRLDFPGTLSLYGNQIAEISDLTLRNVDNLDISGNKITKLSRVVLEAVTYFSVSGNELTKLDGLSLPNFASGTLDFSRNKLTRISNLSLPMLTSGSIRLGDNQLTRVGLSVPTMASGSIDVSNNQIDDLADLEINIPADYDGEINLYNNKVTSLSGGEDLPGMLYLTANQLTQVKNVEFRNLTSLTLDNNKSLTQVTNLALPRVTTGTVSMSGTGITEIDGLNLSNLTSGQLRVPSSALTSVKNVDLRSMVSGSLDLSNNQLTTLSDINLSSLTTGSINLNNNKLTTLSALDLRAMTSGQINIASNELASVDGLNVASLTTGRLNLASNKLTAVNGLELPSLTTGALDLSGNQLTSIQGLKLGSLTSGQVSLANNKLAKLSGISLPAITTGKVDLTGNLFAKFSDVGIEIPATAKATLTLSKNKLTSTAGIERFDFAGSLYLASNQIQEIKNLELKNVTFLDLQSNVIASVDGLKLPGITTGRLILYANKLTSLRGLSLPNATTATLEFHQNLLTEVKGLDLPRHTGTLYFATNRIASFESTKPSGTVDLGVNKIDSLSKVKLPETFSGSLNLEQNQLSSLDGLGALSKLSQLRVGQNRIADVSAAASKSSSTYIDASSQTITLPEIQAGKAQDLTTLVTYPKALGTLTWSPPTDNMPAVNLETSQFTAAKAGSWKLGWYTQSSQSINYGGMVTGEAVGQGAVDLKITGPSLVSEEAAATFTAVSTGLTGKVSYQWFLGGQPVEGATGATYTVRAATRDLEGSAVSVAMAHASGTFNAATTLSIQPAIADPALASCLSDRFGPTFTITQTRQVTSLTCSYRGIRSLDDFGQNSVIATQGGASVDLSGNLISDLSPLMGDSGQYFRRDVKMNLSDNLISSVAPFRKYASTGLQNDRYLILDGNRISDISALSTIDTGYGRPFVSVERQRVSLPGIAVGQVLTLPKAVDAAGDAVAPTVEGITVPAGHKFLSSGAKELAWDVPLKKDIVFNGVFVVPVGMGASLSVDNPTPGNFERVSFTVLGAKPNEVVSLSMGGSEVLTKVATDAGGMLRASFEVPAPPVGGKVDLVLTGDRGTTLTTALEIAAAEVVQIPDAALAKCVREELHLDASAVLYRNLLERRSASLEGTFTWPDASWMKKAQREDQSFAFTCANAGVRDLTGLDAIAASTIDLRGNSITQLEGVKINSATGALYLDNNHIGEFGAFMQANPDVSVAARNQVVDLPIGLTGQSTRLPEATGTADKLTTETYFPEDMPQAVDGSVAWKNPGDYEYTFISYTDNLSKFLANGTVRILVVDQGVPRVSIAPSEVYPTQMINMLVTGMVPGEKVQVTLHSQPLLLGTAVADELGMVRIDNAVIPREFPAGDHAVRALGLQSERTAEAAALKVLQYPADGVIPEVVPDPAGDGKDSGNGNSGSPGDTSGGDSGTPQGQHNNPGPPSTGGQPEPGLVALQLLVLIGVVAYKRIKKAVVR